METTISIIIGGLLAGSAYAMLAIGFNLIYSVTGLINLAQGAFAGIGALVMYVFLVALGWPFPLAFVASVAVITIIAAIAERLVIRPGLGKLSHSNLLLLTVALLIMFQGAALIVWGSQPYSLPSFSGEQPLRVSVLFIPTQSFWLLGSLTVVVGGLWWMLNRTSFGKALRACAENPDAASLVGIPVSNMILFAFAASGAIGAIGGIMVSPITSLAFDSAAIFTANGFASAVLGGLGSFFGGVLGGLTLGVMEQLAAGFISSLFSSTVALFALLVVLVWRPRGILGQAHGRRVDVQEPPSRGGYTLPARFHHNVWRYSLPVGIFILALPLFVQDPALLNSLVLTGIFFIVAIGLDLLVGFAGQISLGQAGFMAIGGYTSAILAAKYNVPPLLGVLAGLALSLAIATALGLVSARLRGIYLAMATMAFGVLVQSLAVGLVGVTGGPSGLVGVPSLSVGPVTFTGVIPNYYLVWLTVGVALFLASNIARSARGRALRAIRTDQTAAQALGVNVVALKIQVFLVSAGLASIAGSLYAFYFHFLSPEMVGSQTSFDLITMLVLGGEGTIVGPVFGVLLLTFLPTLFQPLTTYKSLVEGLLLIVILLRFPGGISGGLMDLWALIAGLSRGLLARTRQREKPQPTLLERE